jgi:hypothetical protein
VQCLFFCRKKVKGSTLKCVCMKLILSKIKFHPWIYLFCPFLMPSEQLTIHTKLYMYVCIHIMHIYVYMCSCLNKYIYRNTLKHINVCVHKAIWTKHVKSKKIKCKFMSWIWYVEWLPKSYFQLWQKIFKFRTLSPSYSTFIFNKKFVWKHAR